MARYKERDLRRYFRGDAAFASPGIYEFLEDEGFLYAIRLPKNQVLLESIYLLLTQPVGRPLKEVFRYYASFSCRPEVGAKSVVSWPKSNGIPANCIPASDLSSPTCRDRPSG